MVVRKGMSAAILHDVSHQDGKGHGLRKTMTSGKLKEGLVKNSRTYEAALREMRKKKPDTKRALKLLQQAMSKGDSTAAYALATWHLHGTHVKKDMTKGVVLLRQAAEENVSEALFDLAVCYEKGAGARKNEKKAYELYLRAAIWGDRQSYYEVGRCLYYGVGVMRNKITANFWLDRAKSFGIS